MIKILVYLNLIILIVGYGATRDISNKFTSVSSVPFGNQDKLRKQFFKNPIKSYFEKDKDNTTSIWFTSAEEIIEFYNFTVEKHIVTTEDDYDLTIFRIPGNLTHSSPAGKPAVFVQHGLLGSCENFLSNGRNSSLAFMLADMGMDVWMGNSRGSIYSRTHRKYNVNQTEFWNYSWHELGVYDLPAVIDYILAKTGHDKIFYIGHSQGNTEYYVLLSERPEYNEKIHVQISLAPAVFFLHVSKPVKALVTMYYPTIKSRTPKEVVLNPLVKYSKMFAPNMTKTIREYGMKLHFRLGDFEMAGASNKQPLHYMQQMLNNGRFRQYDYGPTINKERYGTPEPPNYNLTNVRVPTTIIYSLNDPFTPEEDIKTLYSKISNPNGLFCVEDPKFNHIDFLWHPLVNSLVYNEVTSRIFEKMNKTYFP